MEVFMINLLVWIVYGLVVGLISKAVYRYKDSPTGLASTLLIGVAGSFVGGFINFLLGGTSAAEPAGILMGVVGGIVTCFLYRKLVTEQIKKEMRKLDESF
jgi:uncharacterized membrane protein YeaQ/YmgE (transglycosylase-associated protein family)